MSRPPRISARDECRLCGVRRATARTPLTTAGRRFGGKAERDLLFSGGGRVSRGFRGAGALRHRAFRLREAVPIVKRDFRLVRAWLAERLGRPLDTPSALAHLGELR